MSIPFRSVTTGAVLVCTALLLSKPAHAVPAFARKYQTSCTTCHTVYPKLNPFGEAFRRNGYRFPAVDGDYVKQQMISMGQEAYKKEFPHAVWPGILPASAPLAVGFTGAVVGHPDKEAGAVEENVQFSLADLVEEAQVFAAGSFDDTTTFFGELAFSEEGAEVEHAYVWINDIVGPKHAVNLLVGRSIPNLTSFGPHSTYVGDKAYAITPVTELLGGQSDSWKAPGNYNMIEINGMFAGRVNYSVGLNSGANEGLAPTSNVTVHAGCKLGGMRMDGEGEVENVDATKPWAETAVTLDVFYVHSESRFVDSADTLLYDTTTAFGGGLRGQWQSLEVDVGFYTEDHNHAQAGGAAASALTQYDEVSYVVFPWLVPAVRLELTQLSPDGGTDVSDMRIIPGVAALIRPNLKLVLSGVIEQADGEPDGGWEAAGGSAAPETPDASVGPEFEAVAASLSYAF